MAINTWGADPATDLDSCPVVELLDRACRLQKLSARIDAARAAVLAAAESASEAPGVLRELGFRTASQVVAAETGAPAREVVASQDELVATARGHDVVEFTNRLTVWLINHTETDEVTDHVNKTSCTWNKNTDGSIDGRFHLDPLSAAAVGHHHPPGQPNRPGPGPGPGNPRWIST